MSVDTLTFQAEAKQLLHLMIHSLYSNKEIFLRELVSNASDAVDKLRFEGLKDSSLYENDSNLKIRIEADKEANTISVTDNGIGMSREEAIENLGTIAKSGTSQFLQNLTGDQKKDAQMIGQFGVGFYSSFIVADKVTVESRRAGLGADKAVRWTCSGEADFTVEDIEREKRGTTITLHLKKGEENFAEDWTLRSLIRKYSDHIAVPVEMKKITPPKSEEEGEESKEPKVSYESVNNATALWTRNKNDITDEEYKEFYKHVSHDFVDPLYWSHNRVEGKLDYTSLLYFPAHAPYDLYNRDNPKGLKLYIQRTFIMDNAEQFLPIYLRFVKGIVDCNDLPLNVSREILQNDASVENIRTALTKRAIGELEKLAKNDTEKYATFWENFGQVLKEGVAEDPANKEKVASLLLFHSSKETGKKPEVSLSRYIEHMKPEQEKIYYLLGENLQALKNSAYLEAFRKNDIEVLLLPDRIDEWMVSYLSEYKGKHLQNIAKGELDEKLFGKAESKPDEDEPADSLLTQIKDKLTDKVDDVKATNRLTDSPACLVYGEHDLGIQMRQILAQAGQDIPENKPSLAVNMGHPLLEKLRAEQDEEKLDELIGLLYDQAVLSAGEQLDNPALFVNRLNRLLFASR